MPALRKPARLQPGQTVGVCCPASPPPDPAAIDRALAALTRLGYRPHLARHARNRHGFLAGSDRNRAADLMRLFTDRRVDAIFCVRGGYGCTRILDRLDYAAIRRHPKILLGYSDVTALHCALLRHAGLVSFHGPMLNSELVREDLPTFTSHSLWRMLTQAEPAGNVGVGLPVGEQAVRVVRGGKAAGRLIGGNLSVLCALVGTAWLPSFRERLLFFEDLDEAPYRVDRLLTQLLAAGLLRQVAGVAVGRMRGCFDHRNPVKPEYRQTVEDVLAERLRPLGVPVVTGLPFGHVALNATLPVGVRAELDASRGELRILEPAVR